MVRMCMGFEVHQPYRLDPGFRPGGPSGEGPEGACFSHSNREILERVCRKCYVPATQTVLGLLDEGFRCAFSLSGTLVEQLERWEGETLDLFRQVARHRNAELIGQTYYHSVAGLFAGLEEFEAQVSLHRELVRAVFGVTPEVLENTEFMFNNAIGASARKLGFKAVYTEGVESILGWRSPNYVYGCQGVKLLLRNYPLSDDIAFRFTNRAWGEWPLTPDKYAAWIAASSGDYVNVFIDYETFGEHQWADTGIFDFLRRLPGECQARDVGFALPSEIAGLPAADELSIEDTISWADVEKDVSAWLGNTMQHVALKEVQRARAFHGDVSLWRYLQTSDHFYYMASKFGSCGEVHSYFSPDACTNVAAFDTYMRVLSDYERRGAETMDTGSIALELGSLPPELAFRFCSPIAYTGFAAYSIDDFADQLNYVPEDSLAYHLQRGDFVAWIRSVLKDEQLAAEVSECHSRIELLEVVERRRKDLWSRLR